jgi:tRNA-dependent cyclodipeptide synthase
MEKYRLVRSKYFGSRKFNSHDWEKGSFLGVSINNRQFQNEQSLIQIFNTFKNNVGNGTFKILIGDYLDRCNEMIFNDYEESEAVKISLAKGDVIISKMEKVLQNLDIKNYTFIRTEELYSNDVFPKLFNTYKKAYEQNKALKNLVDKTIEQFFYRMNFKNNSDIKLNLGVNYLIEELAIFEMMINNGDFINVYPGKHLQILKEIVKEKVEVSEILKKYLLVELNFIKID